jgi:fibronectin-binding autotransporter adhesin
VLIENLATWRQNGWSETVAALVGTGTVQLGNGTLTISNHTDSQFSGSLSGSGATCLVKRGAGRFVLGGSNAITGRVQVNEGILLAEGPCGPGQVLVNQTATFGGRGTVGPLGGSGGLISPGFKFGLDGYVGALKTSGLALGSTHAIMFVLKGTNANHGYDRVVVNGAVNLGGATLDLRLLFTSSISNRFTLIENDGVDAVIGTFAGLAEGATFTNGMTAFKITYAGGTGNDVVVTQVSAQPESKLGGLTLLPNGAIQIGGSGAPNLAYWVMTKTNLNQANWEWLGTANADAGGRIEFVDNEAANHPMRFYRFIAQ